MMKSLARLLTRPVVPLAMLLATAFPLSSAGQVVINEFLVTHQASVNNSVGDDELEFVELVATGFVPAGQYWLLIFDGDSRRSRGNPGRLDAAYPIPLLNFGQRWVIGDTANFGNATLPNAITVDDDFSSFSYGPAFSSSNEGNLPNGSFTMMIVNSPFNFAGDVNTDYDNSRSGDANNLFTTLSGRPAFVIDGVAVNDGGKLDFTYEGISPNIHLLLPGFDTFFQGVQGASRIPDAVNGNSLPGTDDWIRNAPNNAALRLIYGYNPIPAYQLTTFHTPTLSNDTVFDPPTVTPKPINESIPENVPNATPVGVALNTLTTGGTPPYNYTIVAGNADNDSNATPDFTIDISTGQVSVVDPPNFESINNYQLFVLVTDSAATPTSDLVEFNIAITDVPEPPITTLLEGLTNEESPYDNNILWGRKPRFLLSVDDPENDFIQYEIEVNTDPGYGSLTRELVYLSNSFPEGTYFYQVGQPLSINYSTPFNPADLNDVFLVPGTYHWRARARDFFSFGPYDQDGPNDGGPITNDNVPQFQIAIPWVALTSADASATEGADTATFTIELLQSDGGALIPVPNLNETIFVDIDISGTALAAAAAPAGADYTVSPPATIINGTLMRVAVAANTTLVTVTAVDDNVFEGLEVADLTVVPVANASLAGYAVDTTDDSISIDIVDDELAPELTALEIQNLALAEPGVGTTTTTINATMDNAAGVDATVDIALTAAGVEGTTAGTSDVTFAGTITIPAYSTEGFVTLDVDADDLVEGTETFQIEVTATTVVNDLVGAPETTSVASITDADTATIEFASAATELDEGDVGTTDVLPAFLLNVTPTNASLAVAVTGTFADAGTGTATETANATMNDDYNATGGTITWNAGAGDGDAPDSTGSAALDVNGDTVYEGNQTIDLTFTYSSGPASIGTNGTLTHTIIDDEVLPELVLTADTSPIAEDGGTSTIEATFAGPTTASELTVSFNFTLSGNATTTDDYTLSQTEVTFPALSTQQDTTLTGVADTLIEGIEDVIIGATDLTNLTDTTAEEETVDITDAELFRLRFFGNNVNADEDAANPQTLLLRAYPNTGSNPATFQYDVEIGIIITSTTDGTVLDEAEDNATVNGFAHDDFDFAGNVTVTAGTTAYGAALPQTANVTINDDEFFEPDELITFEIVDITINGNSYGVIDTTTDNHIANFTINNDDGFPTVGLVADNTTVSEDGGPTIEINATLSERTEFLSNVTISFTDDTATGGADYNNALMSVEYGQFELSGTDTFVINDDRILEPDEEFDVVVNDREYDTDQLAGPDYETSAGPGAPIAEPTITITDDDFATIEFAAATTTEAEGSDDPAQTLSTRSFDVTLSVGDLNNNAPGAPNSGTTAADIDFDYETAASSTTPNASDTAGPGLLPSDYDAVAATTATFPAASTDGDTVGLDVDIREDIIDEPNEFFDIDISNIDAMGQNATFGTNTTLTVEITDDDLPPAINITITAGTLEEDPGDTSSDVTVTIESPGVSGFPITADIIDNGGTAADTDYTITDPNVSILPGNDTFMTTIESVDDGLVENNEVIVIALFSPANATLGTPSSDTIDLTSEDAVEFDFNLAADSTVEDDTGNNTLVNVALDMTITAGETPGELTDDVTLTFVDNGSTATAGGTDFTDDSALSVTIGTGTQAGTSVGNYTFTVIGDDLYEPDETVIRDIDSVAGLTDAAVGSTTVQHIHTITDDDDPPTVEIYIVDTILEEDGATDTITIAARITSTPNVSGVPVVLTANYNAAASFGAVNGLDYDDDVPQVLIAPGNTYSTTNITLTALEDALVEGTESFNVTLVSANADAVMDANDTVTITITDDELGTVDFNAATSSVNENVGGGTQNVPIDLALTSGDGAPTLAYPVVVAIAATPGTPQALTPEDYTPGVSPLTFIATSGPGSLNYALGIVNDARYELDEDVDLALSIDSAPSVVSLGAPTTHNVTIVNDDAAPELTIFSTSAGSINEFGAPTSATLTLGVNQAAGVNVTVSFNTAGSSATINDDYTVGGNSSLGATFDFDIPADNTLFNFQLEAVNDSLVELLENATLTITGATVPDNATLADTAITVSGGPTQVVDIVDDEQATIDYTTDADSGTEDTDATLSVQLVITGNDDGVNPLQLAVAVDFTVADTGAGNATLDVDAAPFAAGEDYRLDPSLSDTFAIGAQNSSLAFVHPVNDDNVFETPETFVLNVTVDAGPATVGTNGTITYTIIDNEPVPEITLAIADADINENGPGTTNVTATSNVTLGFNVDVNLVFSGTAEVPTDPALDYILANTITILAGDTSASNVLTANEDALVEGTETVTVTIDSLTSPITLNIGTPDSDSVDIIDDESATVAFVNATDDVLETDANAPLNVPVILTTTGDGTPTLQGALTVTIDFDTGNASFTAEAADYNPASPSQVVFSDGATNNAVVNYPLVIVGDNIYEPTETVILGLGTLTGDPADVTGLGTPDPTLVNILNDDTAPSATISVDTNTVNEDNGGTATFNVTLDAATEVDATVTIAQTSGTATAPTAADDDYQLSSTTITVAGDGTTLSAEETLTADDDLLFETDETANFEVTGFTDITGPVTVIGTLNITIVDDEDVTLEFTSGSETVAESVGTVDSVVELTINSNDVGALTTAVDVAYTVTDQTVYADPLLDFGNASLGADYTNPAALSGTFTAGNATASTLSLTTTIIDDPNDEPDEDFFYELTGATNATIGATSVRTTTITDNDAAPTVTLSVDNTTINEDSPPGPPTNATITATLDNFSGFPITVNLVVNGSSTATDAVDFTFPATIAIPIGSTTGNGTLEALDEIDVPVPVVVEPDEFAVLDLDSVDDGNATIGAPAQVNVTIVDEEQVTITFSNDTLTQVEGDAGTTDVLVQVEVDVLGDAAATLAGAVEGTISLNGALSTAIDTVDFTQDTTPTVNFVAGSADGETDNYTLTVVGDTLFELDENVTLDLAVTSGPATLGIIPQANITIQNDDDAPNVTLSAASPSINEDDTAPDNATLVTATLDAIAGAPINVTLAFSGDAIEGAGNDYTLNTTILIPAGDVSADETLTSLEDSLAEGNETITIDIDSVDIANEDGVQQVNVTLVDDEAATVDFNAPTSTVVEDNTTHTIQIDLTLTGDAPVVTQSAINVTINDDGTGNASLASDYNAGSVVGGEFAAGASTGATLDFDLPILEDTLPEDDETVDLSVGTLTGGATVGGQSTHTVTIQDDGDAQPNVTLSLGTGTILEDNAGNTTLVATLDFISGQTITVPINAPGAGNGEAADLAGGFPTSIVINPGDIEANVTVTAVDDALVEGTETIDFSTGAVTNATDTGAIPTLTITDDEDATVDFNPLTNSTDESTSPLNATVELTLTSSGEVGLTTEGALVFNVTDDTTVATGNATVGADYTAFGGGTVTFPASSGNASTQNVSITVLPDLLVEGDENIFASLSDNSVPAGLTGSAGSTQFNGTIIEDDIAELSFSGVTDGDENVLGAAIDGSITLNTNNNFAASTTVEITIGGTATEGGGNDYTFGVGSFSAPTLSVTFPAATPSVVIPIIVNDDGDPEGAENVTLDIDDLAAYDLGTPANATITIIDDDVNISPKTTANQDDAGNNMTVPLAAANERGIGLNATVLNATYPGATPTALLDGVAPNDAFTDLDGDGLRGMAIIGTAASPFIEGVWQYSTDNQASWSSVDASTVGDNASILLEDDGNTTIRFLPNVGYDGNPGALRVRLFEDDTNVITDLGFTFTNGDTVDLTVLPNLLIGIDPQTGNAPPNGSIHGGPLSDDGNLVDITTTINNVNTPPSIGYIIPKALFPGTNATVNSFTFLVTDDATDPANITLSVVMDGLPISGNYQYVDVPVFPNPTLANYPVIPSIPDALINATVDPANNVGEFGFGVGIVPTVPGLPPGRPIDITITATDDSGDAATETASVTITLNIEREPLFPVEREIPNVLLGGYIPEVAIPVYISVEPTPGTNYHAVYDLITAPTEWGVIDINYNGAYDPAQITMPVNQQRVLYGPFLDDVNRTGAPGDPNERLNYWVVPPIFDTQTTAPFPNDLIVPFDGVTVIRRRAFEFFGHLEIPPLPLEAYNEWVARNAAAFPGFANAFPGDNRSGDTFPNVIAYLMGFAGDQVVNVPGDVPTFMIPAGGGDADTETFDGVTYNNITYFRNPHALLPDLNAIPSEVFTIQSRTDGAVTGGPNNDGWFDEPAADHIFEQEVSGSGLYDNAWRVRARVPRPTNPALLSYELRLVIRTSVGEVIIPTP